MIPLFKYNASQKNNIGMRYTFIYLFIGYLTTLIPLIEYAQEKESNNSQTTNIQVYLVIYLIFFSDKDLWLYIVNTDNQR